MNEQTLLSKVSAYAPEQLEQLRQTLSEARQAFQNTLPPGDVTSAHPLGVAAILAEWRVPVPLIATTMWSAALHSGSYNDFVPILSESHARLACHLLNFTNLLTEYRRKHEKCKVDHALLADFWQPGFVVLLLAIFLDTIRRAAAADNAPDKKALASQAHILFEPLVSDQLGLWSVRRELCDLAFQCDDPHKYAEARQILSSQQHELELAIENITSAVESKAHEYGIASLVLRPQIAHPYKVNKLSKHKRHLSVCNLLSFVALLPDEGTCYRFLHPLHLVSNRQHPSKGYVAHARPDGSHSLHSRTNIPPYGPLSFYIRTPAWDEENNYGVLSHWWHGEKTVFEDPQLVPYSKGRIFVYTEEGEPHLLPPCATPVDLAYKMYEIAGHHFSRAYVFGKGLVESDYCLQDGDVIQIIQGHHPEPDPAWLTSVKTKEAQKYIHLWESRHAGHGHKHPGQATPTVPLPSKEEREITLSVVIPAEYEDARYHRCVHCKPFPPQPICAYATHRGRFTIHHIGCPTLHHRMQTIPISWRENTVRSVAVVFEIEAWDHVGLLREIADKIAACNANIINVQAESRMDMTVHLVISLQEKDPAMIENIRHAIRDISAVHTVAVAAPEETTVSAPYTSRSTAKILNPYTTQPVDSHGMFFGRREEILHIWRTLESGGHQNSILFWGQQHIGKTSLLKHFEARSQEDSAPYYIPVYITTLAWEQHSHPEISDLLLWLASEIEYTVAHASSKHRFHPPMLNRQQLQTQPEQTLLDYIDQLKQAVHPLQLIVMIDEFQRLIQTPDAQRELLIRCLKNLLVTFSEVSFIFAGWGLKSRLLQHIQNWTTIIPLRVLDPHAAEQLIRMPVRPFTYAEGVIENIMALTGRHPYYIHLLCGAMIDEAMDRPIAERTLTQPDLNNAAEKLLRGNSAPFGQLLFAVPDADIVLDGLVQSPSPGDRYVPFNTLFNMLHRHLKVKLSVGRVHQVLEELLELEVVEQSAADNDAYRICLPLLHLWIQRNPIHPERPRGTYD